MKSVRSRGFPPPGRFIWIPLLLVLIHLAACSPSGSPDSAGNLVHLTDHLQGATYEASGPDPATPGSNPIRYQFRSTAAGWTARGALNLEPTPDGLKVRGDLADGLLMSPELDIPWRKLHEVVLSIRVSEGKEVRLFWTESDRRFLQFWSQEGALSFPERLHLFRSARLQVLPTRDFQNFRIAARNLDPPGWASGEGGTARVRRLFLQFPGGGSGEVELAEISLIRSDDHFAGRNFGVESEMLAGIVRESVFFRIPGRLTWNVPVPGRARLETFLAIPDDRGEWEFEIGYPGGEPFLRQRITGGQEWHEVSLDLPSGMEQAGGLTVSVRGESGIALLGSPIVAATGNIKQPPRVILYVADALSARHLGSYGYTRATSPVLDGLAAEGARFADCVAQSAWTRPSTASLFTGLYPPAHGVVSWSDRLPPSVTTIAELFRSQGFYTISFITNPHAGVSAGLEKGFDVVHETPAITGPLLAPEGTPAGSALLSSGTSLAINRLFLPWLSTHSHLPAFIYLHSMDPHYPYDPPSPFDRRFLPRSDRTPSRDPGDSLAISRDRYDGDVAFNDEQIGRIVDLLEVLEIRESTLFTVTSDHGEEFGEHGGAGHRNHLHGEVTGIPWILSFPGRVPAGTVIPDRVTSIDIFPTLVDLIGLPAPPGMQGRSMVPALHGGRMPDRPVFSHLIRRVAAEDRQMIRETSPLGEIALWEGTWKYLLADYSPHGPVWERLFQLREDPQERNDLSEELPELVQKFRKLTEKWYGEQIRIRESLGRGNREFLHDEEAERRLRALGYLQ
ncbi:MAG: sulfatase [Acidobacteriota bacterium]